MSKEIIINVPTDFRKGVTVEVNGVVGSSCTALTEQLEAAFGKSSERELKDEHSQRSQDQHQQQ